MTKPSLVNVSLRGLLLGRLRGQVQSIDGMKGLGWSGSVIVATSIEEILPPQDFTAIKLHLKRCRNLNFSAKLTASLSWRKCHNGDVVSGTFLAGVSKEVQVDIRTRTVDRRRQVRPAVLSHSVNNRLVGDLNRFCLGMSSHHVEFV